MAKKLLLSSKRIENEFESIWASYPVKKGKCEARYNYKKLLVEGYSIDEIEKAVFDYIGFTEDCNVLIYDGGKFFKDIIRNHLRKKNAS